jgi:hypothetical protein
MTCMKTIRAYSKFLKEDDYKLPEKIYKDVMEFLDVNFVIEKEKKMENFFKTIKKIFFKLEPSYLKTKEFDTYLINKIYILKNEILKIDNDFDYENYIDYINSLLLVFFEIFIDQDLYTEEDEIHKLFEIFTDLYPITYKFDEYSMYVLSNIFNYIVVNDKSFKLTHELSKLHNINNYCCLYLKFLINDKCNIEVKDFLFSFMMYSKITKKTLLVKDTIFYLLNYKTEDYYTNYLKYKNISKFYLYQK